MNDNEKRDGSEGFSIDLWIIICLSTVLMCAGVQGIHAGHVFHPFHGDHAAGRR
jgi:hypothetical protein